MSFSSNAIQGLWAKGHTPELYRVILAVIANIRIDKGTIDYFYSLNLCEHINNEDRLVHSSTYHSRFVCGAVSF